MRAGTSAVRRGSDPWPVGITPDFTDIDVGIARTSPDYEEHREVREVEALFADSIDHAVRALYIENQFVTANRMANRLAKRMRERPELDRIRIPVNHSVNGPDSKNYQCPL